MYIDFFQSHKTHSILIVYYLAFRFDIRVQAIIKPLDKTWMHAETKYHKVDDLSPVSAYGTYKIPNVA